MPHETGLFILVLLSGFYMSWSIGANDVANAMGTSVGSGALTLRRAVIVAAILEFAGAYFFGSYVSETIQSGIIQSSYYEKIPMQLVYGMLASLISAGLWLQLATYYGWPVSTTHTIIGAIVGFGLVTGGFEAIYWGNVGYIFSSWILSPMIGGIFSFLIFTLLRSQIFYRSKPLEATKKLTPFIVFFVIAVMSLIFLFHGLKNLNLHLSFNQSLGISIISGAIAALISYFLIRNIKNSDEDDSQPGVNYDVLNGLQKARKHLQRVQSSSIGELHYQVSALLGEVDTISHSVQPVANLEKTHSEYAKVEKIFGYLQIMSACLMAFAHGANDVANAIGPLSASIAILTSGIVALSNPIPPWGLALGGLGIVVGLATWGWRVIETIGRKITELTPTRGFAAEFGAATTIVVASRMGLPISTTHTLVGSVIGVGLAGGIGALNLSTMRDIIISWIVTIPAGALLCITCYYIINAIFG